MEWWTWSGTNAEWVGAVGTVVGAAVAGVFGYLAWKISRRTEENQKLSRDNQERSTLTAATEPATISPPDDDATGAPDGPRVPPGLTDEENYASEIIRLARDQLRVRFSVERFGGESWRLINGGREAAYNVEIDGLTELDKRRLTGHAPTPVDIGAGDFLMFTLVSRFSLSGPANVVVRYALEPGGPKARKVLFVPAE